MLRRPRVYVVHAPTDYDGQPKFDLSPAAEFGELHVLLPPGRVQQTTAELVDELRRGLADFREDDYLLLVGDFIVIACSVALAARATGGKLKLLKWSNPRRAYKVIAVDLTDPAEQDVALTDELLDLL